MQMKDDLLREEFKAGDKCERIRVFRSLLAQPPTYYSYNQQKEPLLTIFLTLRENIY